MGRLDPEEVPVPKIPGAHKDCFDHYFILVFGGALLFYLFESGNLARGMGPGRRS